MKHMLIKLVFAVFFSAWMPSIVFAQVMLDNSFGHPNAQPVGPHYAILPEYGKIKGGNLFQSFSTFNLKQDESATFSGPSSIDNIFVRVTGRQVSSIDGTIESSIPGA